ncbi:calcium-activated chloride channel regulator 4A-like [Penaeus chinensis]|uniref:calcium-activated chloride channel regulator 4A-like n=1 Tax=Penaeus chinensis TaxID=139456 RepID=UPI001FB60B0B|nr:calcium-activated chloride channel regulator 4A-like [Penaeus chinensis]
MRTLAAALTVALATLTLSASASASNLINNGYEDLVVAISPSVDESNAEAIISSIKKTISETSSVLFKASRQRAFFRDVKILLPKTWTNTSYDEAALNENFEDSEIRVDARNVVYGDQPYTDQPGGCGVPGRYIHLTPEYLTDDAQAAWWGPRNKTLVHEWAKLRWGVFDEIGYPHDPTFPLFYWNTQITADGIEDVVIPNYCANHDLTGELMDIVSRGQCSFKSGFPDENCRFLPSANQDATSSLMAYYYINSIVEFCDTATDEQFSHNSLAPNRHNLMCNSRSVWDVVNLHSDFANGANPPIAALTPTRITVLRQEEAKFCLVLDYSLSMEDSQRVVKLQRTAQRWILHEVAQGSSVGIVKFWGTATVTADLTEITDQASRQNLANLIDRKLGSSTSIGAGLSLAVNNVLVGQKNPVIVLVTDGEENKSPYISDVKDKVIDSGARVVTIAFGDKADPNLESLAEATGGKTFTVVDTDDGGMLDDAFLGALTYQPGDKLTDMKVQIYEYEYEGKLTQLNETFFVDASVGRDLEFRLDTNDVNYVTSAPVLARPNGTQIGATSFDSGINMWIISVPLAEEGEWAWIAGLSGGSNKYVRVGVTAKARDPETMPIYTRSWLSDTEDVDATVNPIIVYAEVKQGNNPVVGARVRASVTQPYTTAEAVELDLLDNGQGADTQAGDGVYSRYLTVYSTTGRYAVKAQVWDDGSALVNNGFTTSRKRHPRSLPAFPLDTPTYCCGSVVPVDPELATPTGNFTRSASGGSFRATAVPSGDVLPPSRVTDLQTEMKSPILTLTWTATGDDYDYGIVSGYEIRLSANRSQLLEDTFDSAENETLLLSLEESMTKPELLLEAGEKVELNFTIGDKMEMDKFYFVALRAVDDGGSVSLVSNLAAALSSSPPSEPEGLAGWAIALIVIGCLAAVAAIVGGVFYAKKKDLF